MKTRRFGMVLSADEKRILHRLAEVEGLSSAAMLRRLIRKADRELADTPTPIAVQSAA